jgi:primosomal replication protein N
LFEKHRRLAENNQLERAAPFEMHVMLLGAQNIRQAEA